MIENRSIADISKTYEQPKSGFSTKKKQLNLTSNFREKNLAGNLKHSVQISNLI